MVGLSVEFSSSGDLLRGGWWFCSRWLLFLFLRSTLLFTFQDGLSVLHIPLVFTLSRQFRIFVGHTEQNWFLSRKFVFIYRLVCSITDLGPGLARVEESVPMGGFTPDLPPPNQIPHLIIT